MKFCKDYGYFLIRNARQCVSLAPLTQFMPWAKAYLAASSWVAKSSTKHMMRAVLALPWPLATETWAANRPLGRARGQAAMRYLPSVIGGC